MIIWANYFSIVRVPFQVYDKIAVKLTDLENHRTQSEYDDSLTLKLYLLQFVNFYSSIFYIAFIQGTTAGLPGDNSVPIRSSGASSFSVVKLLVEENVKQRWITGLAPT